ncbi:MAG: TIGR02266 family protein [Polyangiaceae bacterium]
MTEEAPPSFPASGPAREARRLLSSALESLQLRAGQTAGVRQAIEAAAEASSLLYGVEAGESESSFEGIRAAIEQLGVALGALQRDSLSDPTVLSGTETIARTLALLYPVARAQQRARRNVIFHTRAPEAAELSLPEDTVPPAPPAGRPRILTPSFRGHEQRSRGERVFVEADIGLLSDSHFYTGLSQDLSSGGVFIATYQPKPAGTEVGLYFALPDGYVVEARGVVRWTREGGDDTPPGMGVAFQDLSPEDLAAIEHFCESRAPMYHDSADN